MTLDNERVAITSATKALVVGLGRSGFAAVRLLHKLGAGVAATDSAPRVKISGEVLSWLEENRISLQCGTLAGDLLEGINLIVVSPGVPLQQQFFAAAREQGIRVIGELALA
ncbi:MAG: hypothetical protein KKG47_06130, partial [Proteobacteria bacterium]|nr:hypothetical protein [Pseudomonadota bacterium]MBU1737052.1 hypothetical protein [Pseudomonadota bacterium]